MAPNHRGRVAPKLKWVAGIPQPCQVCTVDIWDVGHWIAHMKTHCKVYAIEGGYRCPLCKQTSTEWWRLNDHFARHYIGYKPHQCTEMIPVVDTETPGRDSTAIRVERCPHREVDPQRLNVHRVRRHGHQPTKKAPKASDDISNSGRAQTSSSSDPRAARKSSPYDKSYPRTRRAAQLEQHAASEHASSPSSSKLTLDMPRYPGNYVAAPNRDRATPAHSLAQSPASYGATPSDLSPASTSSLLSTSTHSTPHPTDFGLGVACPSPVPSPSYLWNAPLPQSPYMATPPPPPTGLSVGAYDEGPSWESLDLWLSGLSPEAKYIIDKDMETFARALGL